MGMYILIGLTLFFLALLLMTEYIGRNFWRFAPKEHLKQGGKIHVYNRGSFYAIGKDSVGAKLVYVKYRRRYRFVKLCELLRKGFCVEDDEEQLIPDSHSSENDEAKDETEVENEM